MNNGRLYRGEIYVWSNKQSRTLIPALRLKTTHNKNKVKREIAIFLLAYNLSSPKEFFNLMNEIDEKYQFNRVRESDGVSE